MNIRYPIYEGVYRILTFISRNVSFLLRKGRSLKCHQDVWKSEKIDRKANPVSFSHPNTVNRCICRTIRKCTANRQENIRRR